MNNDQLIGAIAVDLKRVAQAFGNNSFETGNRFIKEVFYTIDEMTLLDVEPYVQNIFKKLSSVLTNTNHEELAEDALMYSTILHNYYVSRLKST
jgi:hypothetical protein